MCCRHFIAFATSWRKTIPASFEQAGAWQVPNGDPTYAYFARSMTTTSLTPEQIHNLGLSEVKRIRAEMEKVKDQTGFKGTFAEFLNYLRTDPKFYFKDGDQLLQYARASGEAIDPLLVNYFALSRGFRMGSSRCLKRSR